MSSTRLVRPIVALAAVALLAPAAPARQDVALKPKTRPAATAPDEKPLPDLTEIKKQLTELRGLEFKRDVPSKRQPLEAWGEHLDKELEKFFPPERQAGMQAGLQRLGMFLETLDVGGGFKDALMTQAGAYYDPETGTFYYLMVDLPEMALRTIAAHELVHALQDQHFDLTKLIEPVEATVASGVRNDDQILALRFLIEGEATYVQTLWQTKEMMGMDLAANPQMEAMNFKMMATMEIEQLVDMTKQQAGMFGEGEADMIVEAMNAMDEIPPYILHPLYAAYMKGAYYTMSLRHAGGWEAVAEAFRNPPASAEQVLHPDRILEKPDVPTPLTMPAFRALGTDWKIVDAAVHGEFYLNLLLRNFGKTSFGAADATEGWDGDVYTAWQNTEKQTLIALATTWDTEKDAHEFYQAYRSILPRKYAALDAGSAVETDVRYEYACGDAALGHGVLVHRGREVFSVEGGGADLVGAMMRELTATTVKHVE